MLRNPQVESFLSSRERIASTRRQIENSRNAIEEIPILIQLKKEFALNESPDPARIRAICSECTGPSLDILLEQFAEGANTHPFFVMPMQGQSIGFTQRVVLDINPRYDLSVDVINCAQLSRHKRTSKKNLAERGISFIGRGSYTYAHKAGGLILSHWTHNADMSSLSDASCWEVRQHALEDGQLIENRANETFMFESSNENAILITIELKDDSFAASLTFSALDKTLRFQAPSDHLDSRIQLSLSLLQEFECTRAIPLMKNFLKHPRHYVRWHAMQSILGIDALQGLDELTDLAENDVSQDVRNAASRTLEMISNERLRHAC